MMGKIKIVLSQQNVIVGDIKGNLEKARRARTQATGQGADLVVFSELFLSGYPPEDLVLKPSFMDDITRAIHQLAQENGAACLIGTPWIMGERGEDKIYNAVLLLEDGKIASIIAKKHLPNYAVFDEQRIFSAGALPKSIPFRGAYLGIRICEDIWTDHAEIIDEADIMIVLNGSPFEEGKLEQRMFYCRAYVAAHQAPLIYVNQVGGQDELVFDGASFVMNREGEICAQASSWEEAQLLSVFEKSDHWQCAAQTLPMIEQGLDALWQAMMLGMRDYVKKNHFSDVVLGLSGGIDSALVAVLACDALGSSNVRALMLPSPFTSEASKHDADLCAKLLKLQLETISIDLLMADISKTLAPFFANTKTDRTEENIQSRLRGLLLMAWSNKFGSLLLSTGNKSEMSVGYATLYGDMNGGFNPIKDVYKTRIYQLAQWRNRHFPKNALGTNGQVIPQAILDKAPSAELRENQKDQDALPPYDVLDDILQKLIDQEWSLDAIIQSGHQKPVVDHIAHLVHLAEYKRRQAPLGVRLSQRNFGRGRRYPVTHHYRPERW